MKLFLAFVLSFGQVWAQNASLPIAGTYAAGMFAPKNYVKNPDCAKNTVGITASGGSLTRGTTTPLNGDTGTECVIDASASGQTYTFAMNTLGQDLKGQNCEVKFVYEGDASLYKAYVKQGSSQSTTDLQLTNPTASQPVSINFPCGDLSTATTLVIESTSASAAAFSTAKVYAGLATNLGSVAQASFVGSLKYTGATNCNWSTNSTSYAAFAADTDCSTAVLVSGSGTPSAPGTKIPGVVFSNLGPGTYKVTANFAGYKGGTVDASVRFAINDGTTTGPGTNIYVNTTDGAYAMPTSVVGYFTYASAQSSLTFQVYGFASSSASNSAHILANETGIDFTISVEYFPTSSQLALNSNLPSYPTIQTFTSGSGTYTKPAGVQYIRVRMVGGGGGGAAGGTTISTSATSGTATTFGTLTAGGGGGAASGGGSGGTPTLGAGFVGSIFSGGIGGSQTLSQVPTTLVPGGGNGASSPFGGAGGGGNNGAAATSAQANTGSGGGGGAGSNTAGNVSSGPGGGAGAFLDVLSVGLPSNTISYSIGSGGSGGTGTNAGGAGGSGYIEVTEYYSAVPAPLLVGSVTSNTSGTERIERAQISCGSSSTIDSQSGSWISSIGNITSNRCTVTIATGMFSATPICTASYKTTDTTTLRGVNLSVASATSFSIGDVYYVGGSAPGASTGTDTWYIICMGPR